MEEKNPWKNLLPSEASSSEEITKNPFELVTLEFDSFSPGVYIIKPL